MITMRKVKIEGSRDYKVSAEISADGIEKVGKVYFARDLDSGEYIKFSSKNLSYEKGETYELPIEMVDVKADGSPKLRDVTDDVE